MTQEELLAQMEKLAAAGDKAGYDAFVLEHFQEFPEEVQGKVLYGFFSDTLEKEEGKLAIAELQERGMEAMEEIEKIRASAQNNE